MSNEAPKVIPYRLKLARMDKDLSQPDMADVIGVTRQTVSEYETGKAAMNSDRLGQWAHATQKPVGYFYGEGPR
jgi:transcriptional regulator with XRE-family HTH domain